MIADAVHIDAIRYRLPAVAGLVSDDMASGHMTLRIAAASPLVDTDLALIDWAATDPMRPKSAAGKRPSRSTITPTMANPDMARVLKAEERLTLCRMFVEVAREAHLEYMPKLAFGSRLETLVVGVCVAIGHLDGKPFSAAKLAAYLACPRTSVLRRLDALAKMQIIVRRGTRYFINEQRFNSDSALKSHDKVRRIVLKAAGQLSEMDTLES
jgi:hypothetical protein